MSDVLVVFVVLKRVLSRPVRAVLFGMTASGGLVGCAAHVVKPSEVVEVKCPVSPRSDADIQRIAELERLLAERQRRYIEEKRRLESALKDSQKQTDEIQKKLDTLIEIDREIRLRGTSH